MKRFKYIEKLFLDEVHQLFLFIPVLMGCGVFVYLKYFFQNYSVIPFVIGCLFAFISLIMRKRQYSNLVNIAIFSFFIGICSAQIDTKIHDYKMLENQNIEHYVEGIVHKAIRKENGINVIIDLNQKSLDEMDKNLLSGFKRVSVKITNKSEIPNKGDEVYLKAKLSSPTPSVMRGAYDFKKDAYFKKIGAYGYATSRLNILSKNDKKSALTKVKKHASDKINKTASNTENSELIKALMLGEKKAIPSQTVDDFRAAGISHLLSISGLHIGLLFGFIFLLIRYLLAISESLTLRYNIKKISASIAITTTFLYVILVGYPMPTIRAFIMIFIVYLGIILDRRALSMRNVAIAAILILLIAPHSILSASFQMSFAAVVALIAAYEFISDKNINLVGIKGYVLGIIFTSIIAIIATSPFAIYNFQNFSTYGVLTNTLVMPIVSFITMPLIVISYILLPLGLGEIGIKGLNISINWISDIASKIANLVGSQILIAQPTHQSMLLFIAGALIICLFKHKLRITGLIILATSIIMAKTIRDLPDIIISPNAEVIAVRNEEGKLTFSNTEEEFICEIMSRINGQKEILTFNDNKLLNCYENSCLYKGVDIYQLQANKKAQHIYIDDAGHTKTMLTY